jgi:Concanavalin A-like lectin/glucanases superfamily
VPNNIGERYYVTKKYIPYYSVMCYNITRSFDSKAIIDDVAYDHVVESSYLRCDPIPSLSAITFSVWIYVADYSPASAVFDYGDQFRLLLTPGAPNEYYFNSKTVNTGATFYKTWRNIAFTVDGKTLVPYEKGIRQPDITMNTALSTTPLVPFFGRIGTSQAGGVGSNGIDFSGNVSDFRIYGSVLSDKQMSNLYNTAVGVTRLTGSFTPPKISPAPKDRKLPDLAWYKLDGDILNYCGNNVGKKDATSGNAIYSPLSSKKCIQITEGWHNYLEVPILPEVLRITFSCWINGTSYAANSRIFDYGESFCQ